MLTSVAPRSTITNGIIRQGLNIHFWKLFRREARRAFSVCIFSARFSKWSERQRGREIRNLLKGIERHQHGFHVLVGDFNTLAPGEILDVRKMPAWIRALVWISGRDIQRETIQVMLDAGYADGYRLSASGYQGLHFSYLGSAFAPRLCFCACEFADRLKACEVISGASTGGAECFRSFAAARPDWTIPNGVTWSRDCECQRCRSDECLPFQDPAKPTNPLFGTSVSKRVRHYVAL